MVLNSAKKVQPSGFEQHFVVTAGDMEMGQYARADSFDIPQRDDDGTRSHFPFMIDAKRTSRSGAMALFNGLAEKEGRSMSVSDISFDETDSPDDYGKRMETMGDFSSSAEQMSALRVVNQVLEIMSHEVKSIWVTGGGEIAFGSSLHAFQSDHDIKWAARRDAENDTDEEDKIAELELEREEAIERWKKETIDSLVAALRDAGLEVGDDEIEFLREAAEYKDKAFTL